MTVNMLGIPEEKGGIKNLFVADEGYLLGDGDQGAFELRILGALANDLNMIKDFSAGRDFHGEVRARLFNRGTTKANYTHQEVLDAKTLVFGPPYGRGAHSIAKQFAGGAWRGLTLSEQAAKIEEAQHWLDVTWSPYGRALEYMRERIQEVHDTGEVKTIYGRKRRWGLITESNVVSVENEARNFSIQSTANDTNLLVMLEIYNTFPHDLVMPLLPTHDSILMTMREDVIAELAPQIEKIGASLPQKLLNTEMLFEFDIEVGKSWGDLVSWKEWLN